MCAVSKVLRLIDRKLKLAMKREKTTKAPWVNRIHIYTLEEIRYAVEKLGERDAARNEKTKE